MIRRSRSAIRALVKALIPGRWRAPLVGLVGGNRLLRRMLANHADVAVIEAELVALPREGWTSFRHGNPTNRRTERVVEIPWVISRYRGEPRVLDIGPAFAHPVYTDRLTALGIPDLNGVDLSTRRIRGMRLIRSDVRAMPFADGYFDLVLCISAIEHVGLDNSRYGVADGPAVDGDVASLREIRRVLAPGGRVLITVPFGRAEQGSWYRQYDLDTWRALVRGGEMMENELMLYAHGDRGWGQVTDPHELAARAYAESGLPGAPAVLCATLVHDLSAART